MAHGPAKQNVSLDKRLAVLETLLVAMLSVELDVLEAGLHAGVQDSIAHCNKQTWHACWLLPPPPSLSTALTPVLSVPLSGSAHAAATSSWRSEMQTA